MNILTTKRNSKIVIVGAGPIGCYLGQLLKHYGFEALLLEEHAEVGKPVQCAGIVGRGVFDEARVPLSRKSILNTIEGAKIFYNGSSFSLNRPKVAYIIDRKIFDKEMSNGLDIEYNAGLREIHPFKEGYILKTRSGDEYYADMVIGADGPNSRVRSSLGFSADIKFYRGCQYRVKMAPGHGNFVEVHYIKPFFLFNWLIPEDSGTIRIGAISKDPYRDLKRFFENLGNKGEILEKNAGVVPIGMCQLVKGNAALVGDAACQLKPITAGGIYYGMKSAELLADAVRSGDLLLYQKHWKDEFEQETKVCLLARDIMANMDESAHERLFNYVKENADLVEKIGDFENHSSILWNLFLSPRTYPAIGSFLREVVKHPKLVLRSLLRTHH